MTATENGAECGFSPGATMGTIEACRVTHRWPRWPLVARLEIDQEASPTHEPRRNEHNERGSVGLILVSARSVQVQMARVLK